MVKSYALGLMIALAAAPNLSGQSSPYIDTITSFQRKGETYNPNTKRMTGSVILPSEIHGDIRPRELSFLYSPGNLDDRFMIVCQGIIEQSKMPEVRGPLGENLTITECSIDGGGYGIFDGNVDAKFHINTRTPNAAGRLDPLYGFSSLPAEEKESATKEQRGWLEKMVLVYPNKTRNR